MFSRNLWKAVEATEAGDGFNETSAVPNSLSDEEVARSKVEIWLSKVKIDKPRNFEGEPGEGCERVKSFLSELHRCFAC